MRKDSISSIINILKVTYPVAKCSLNYTKDYELLFAVRLSAQCTDARVNLVTPNLFNKFPTLESFSNAKLEAVEECIRSCGFYHHKAKDLIECSKVLLNKYNGNLPSTMEELTSLPGIGRKTANLILGDIFKQPSYVCDTHCIRICGRLGITDGSQDPYKVELQIREKIPPEESSEFCHRLVLFGRDYCIARNPKCENCPLSELCPSCKNKHIN